MRSSTTLLAACLAAAANLPAGAPGGAGGAMLAGIVSGGAPEGTPYARGALEAEGSLGGRGVDRAVVPASGRRSATGAQGEPARETLWILDSLQTLGGHVVTLAGAPRIVHTELGPAVEFDGRGDGLFVETNPIAGLERFTIEVTFEPLPGGGEEQRFLHVQEAESEDRALVELRVLPGGRWCLDTYLRRDGVGLTLIDRAAAHPLGRWHVAALVYDGRTLAHYVDGRREAAGPLAFRPLGPGRTSIGVRQNRVSWFRGRIRAIRFVADAVIPRAAPGAAVPAEAASGRQDRPQPGLAISGATRAGDRSSGGSWATPRPAASSSAAHGRRWTGPQDRPPAWGAHAPPIDVPARPAAGVEAR